MSLSVSPRPGPVRCAVCREDDDGFLVRCPRCGTQVHLECVSGGCPSFGCVPVATDYYEQARRARAESERGERCAGSPVAGGSSVLPCSLNAWHSGPCVFDKAATLEQGRLAPPMTERALDWIETPGRPVLTLREWMLSRWPVVAAAVFFAFALVGRLAHSAAESPPEPAPATRATLPTASGDVIRYDGARWQASSKGGAWTEVGPRVTALAGPLWSNGGPVFTLVSPRGKVLTITGRERVDGRWFVDADGHESFRFEREER